MGMSKFIASLMIEWERLKKWNLIKSLMNSSISYYLIMQYGKWNVHKSSLCFLWWNCVQGFTRFFHRVRVTWAIKIHIHRSAGSFFSCFVFFLCIEFQPPVIASLYKLSLSLTSTIGFWPKSNKSIRNITICRKRRVINSLA